MQSWVVQYQCVFKCLQDGDYQGLLNYVFYFDVVCFVKVLVEYGIQVFGVYCYVVIVECVELDECGVIV